MNESLVSNPQETTPKQAEAPLTPEEMKALEERYTVESPSINGTEEQARVEVARVAYEADLKARASRMNTMHKMIHGNPGGFTGEGLMYEDAERENTMRDRREANQKRWETEAQKANKSRPLWQKLFRRNKVTAEDVMRDEADREQQEEIWRGEVKEKLGKLFSGEIALDSASVIEPLRDVNKVYGAHTITDIFLEDMSRKKALDRGTLDLFREVVGKDNVADGYYKEILGKALAQGFIDTLYTRDGLTGRFAEFNDDPKFVESVKRILQKRNITWK